MDAVQIVIKDDFLYIMGHDCITKSVIKNNDLEEICTAKVDMQNGATYFYLSSAFVCN